jgi:CheY-like chemotaxis protein
VLSVGYHAGTPRVVTGDAARIRQVLVNLIGNAVKFTRDGIVRVSVRRTSPIRIEVIDTGIGIAPEEQERIFGQFSQANASVSRRFGGTGLGLAICRRLVEAMGGEIGVISQTEPPSGSTFWLTLPLTASTLPAASAPDTRPLLRLDWPILVVDDHPINRRLVRHMLENQGIAVVLAESGEEALERVSEQRFAAVLMDCMMPGLDGMETTRRMRALGHTLPIIALTASAMAEDQRRCLESGMSDHVAKPIDTTTLLGVLGRHLGQPTVSTG